MHTLFYIFLLCFSHGLLLTCSYAFVLPHTIADYVTGSPPCDLTTVGSFLSLGGYALAVPKDSALLRPLNAALRALRHSGYLDELYATWWHGRTECAPGLSSEGEQGAGRRGGRAGGVGGAGAGQLRVRSTQLGEPRLTGEYWAAESVSLTGGSSVIHKEAERCMFSLGCCCALMQLYLKLTR